MSEPSRNPFEDALRAIAEEISRSVERVSQTDLDDLARATGVDPERAREWADEAARWLQGQMRDMTRPATPPLPPSRPAGRPVTADDPLGRAEPTPLDVPTAEQGAALAALESGRWTIEPGTTSALTVRGEGPGPNNALGLVRELRVRDWIDAGGQVTVAGRHALERWLRAAGRG